MLMDLPVNPSADTGGFELAYEQSLPDTQPYLGPCLFAVGESMTLHEAQPKKKCHINNHTVKFSNESSSNSSNPGKQYRARTAPPWSLRLKELSWEKPPSLNARACLNYMESLESNQEERMANVCQIG